jgi:dCMP deaminase
MDKEERTRKLFKDIALRFAFESHCESRKVSAIAVLDNHIISTGINGTPKGYVNCDDYFKEQWMLSRKTLNEYSDWLATNEWRELHHQWSIKYEIHSEQAMVGNAAKRGISLESCDIYITLEPCQHCAKLLITCGVKRIFYINEYDKADLESKKLLQSCGIVIEKI